MLAPTSASRLRLALLLIVSVFLVGDTQGQHLRGRVVDLAGSALPGASVVAESVDGGNVTIGVAADRHGRFAVDVPPGSYRVSGSFVGFRTEKALVSLAQSDTVDVVLTLQHDVLLQEDIIVESRRATPRVSPVTFTNLTPRELDALPAMKDLPILLATLPSITVHSENGNGIGYSTLRMRGFDQRRIAVSINGIPQNDPEDFNVFWINFFDIQGAVQDIQVQRGANAAFYGPEGIGGAINIVARPYTDSPYFFVEAGGGTFATRRLTAEASTGRLGRYSAFLRVSRLLTDGYRQNSWSEFVRFFGGVERSTERSSVILQAYGGPQRDGLAFSGIPAEANEVRGSESGMDRRFNPSLATRDTESFHQPHLELLHTWRPVDGLELSQAAFGVLGVGYFDFGATFRSADYLRLPNDFRGLSAEERALPLFIVAPDAGVLQRAYLDQWQIGWIPRLTAESSLGTTSVGLEGRLHRSLRWGRIQEASGIPSEVVGSENDVRIYSFRGEKTIASVYGSHLWRGHERIAVQADLHLTHRAYRIYDEAFVGTSFRTPFVFLNPRLGITYNPGRPLSAYASVAIAHREPRMKDLYDGEEAGAGFEPRFERDPTGAFDFGNPLVRPERLYNLEIGMRRVTRSARFVVNTFLMLFDDEIVPSGGLDQFGVPRTGNAERTRHMGVELEAEAMVAEGLTLIGNATISRNRFIRFTEFDPVEGAVRRDGNPIAGFPEQTGYLGARFERGIAGFNIGSRLSGRQHIDNSADSSTSVDPHALVDASFIVNVPGRLDGLRLRLDVNNVLDTTALSYGNVGPVGPQYFPAATRHVFLGASYTIR
jgi:iron complex outermembrane recepter protein